MLHHVELLPNNELWNPTIKQTSPNYIPSLQQGSVPNIVELSPRLIRTQAQKLEFGNLLVIKHTTQLALIKQTKSENNYTTLHSAFPDKAHQQPDTYLEAS